MMYIGVEISEGARAALAASGYATASPITELDPFEGVAFANELLDTLPFLVARSGPDGSVEGPRRRRRVVAGRGRGCHWTHDSAPPRLVPGQTTMVPAGASSTEFSAG
jgi:hypothetical protein